MTALRSPRLGLGLALCALTWTSAQAFQVQQNQPSQTAKPSRSAFDFRLDSLSSAASLVKLLPLVQGAGAGRSAPLVQVEKPYIVGFQWQNTNQSEVALLKREVDHLKTELTRLQTRVDVLTSTRPTEPSPGSAPLVPSRPSPVPTVPSSFSTNPVLGTPSVPPLPHPENSVPPTPTPFPTPNTVTPVVGSPYPQTAAINHPGKLRALLSAMEGLPESTQLRILKAYMNSETQGEPYQAPAIYHSNYRDPKGDQPPQRDTFYPKASVPPFNPFPPMTGSAESPSKNPPQPQQDKNQGNPKLDPPKSPGNPPGQSTPLPQITPLSVVPLEGDKNRSNEKEPVAPTVNTPTSVSVAKAVPAAYDPQVSAQTMVYPTPVYAQPGYPNPNSQVSVISIPPTVVSPYPIHGVPTCGPSGWPYPPHSGMVGPYGETSFSPSLPGGLLPIYAMSPGGSLRTVGMFQNSQPYGPLNPNSPPSFVPAPPTHLLAPKIYYPPVEAAVAPVQMSSNAGSPLAINASHSPPPPPSLEALQGRLDALEKRVNALQPTSKEPKYAQPTPAYQR